MIRRATVAFTAIVLAGCAGGERWLAAPVETLQYEGSDYRVQWFKEGALLEIRVGPRLAFFPDAIVEQRRSAAVAESFARAKCGTPRPQLEAHAPAAVNGTLEQFRYRCV